MQLSHDVWGSPLKYPPTVYLETVSSVLRVNDINTNNHNHLCKLLQDNFVQTKLKRFP